MRIIQSFWSKPMLSSVGMKGSGRFQGGWLDTEYYLMSWAYSCLKLKEYYSDIELYTDEFGKALLIDKLHLPYSKVHVVLDVLNDYDADLWALGKVFTYGLQKEPFIHVDSDIYIWKKFSSQIENADLIAQNIEFDYQYYRNIKKELHGLDFYIPEIIPGFKDLDTCLHAYNMGITGGNNFEFFRSYAKSAIDFVLKNQHTFGSINVGKFNVVYEQSLFYYLAEELKIEVKCFTDLRIPAEIDLLIKSFDNFDSAPLNTVYIHLYGEDCKRNMQFCDKLSEQLKAAYPDFHQLILEVSEKEKNLLWESL